MINDETNIHKIYKTTVCILSKQMDNSVAVNILTLESPNVYELLTAN